MEHTSLDKGDERTDTVCRGCGGAKQLGLVVCWHCFKYRDDIVPFKYFDGSLAEWVRTLAA